MDERQLIETLARELALDSRRLPGGEGAILDAAIEYLRAAELPPSSPNLLFWMPLLRAAAGEGVAVMLDGEGGDELFGQPRYLLADRVRAGRPLAAWRLARRFPGAGGSPLFGASCSGSCATTRSCHCCPCWPGEPARPRPYG